MQADFQQVIYKYHVWIMSNDYLFFIISQP